MRTESGSRNWLQEFITLRSCVPGDGTVYCAALLDNSKAATRLQELRTLAARLGHNGPSALAVKLSRTDTRLAVFAVASSVLSRSTQNIPPNAQQVLGRATRARAVCSKAHIRIGASRMFRLNV